jgi:hypothetical protein
MSRGGGSSGGAVGALAACGAGSGSHGERAARRWGEQRTGAGGRWRLSPRQASARPRVGQAHGQQAGGALERVEVGAAGAGLGAQESGGWRARRGRWHAARARGRAEAGAGAGQEQVARDGARW